MTTNYKTDINLENELKISTDSLISLLKEKIDINNNPKINNIDVLKKMFINYSDLFSKEINFLSKNFIVELDNERIELNNIFNVPIIKKWLSENDKFQIYEVITWLNKYNINFDYLRHFTDVIALLYKYNIFLLDKYPLKILYLQIEDNNEYKPILNDYYNWLIFGTYNMSFYYFLYLFIENKLELDRKYLQSYNINKNINIENVKEIIKENTLRPIIKYKLTIEQNKLKEYYSVFNVNNNLELFKKIANYFILLY